MSIEAMAIALHHSRARGTAKVVLIGIANHDGDGGAWPSVAKLMVYANADRRTVQRAIDELEKLGEVQRVIQSGGTESSHSSSDWHRPNLYHFKLTCPMDCDRSRNHKTKRTWTPELPIDAKTPPGLNSAKTPPGGVQKRRPNLNNNQLPIDQKEAYVGNRAHAHEENAASGAPQAGYALAASSRCPNKPSRFRDRSHDYADSGYCLHCGGHEADHANPSTGEIA